MPIGPVALSFRPDRAWVFLREPCGYDEQSVSGTGSMDAVQLLDRLLLDSSGCAAGPGSAQMLTVPDRDRVLAALYSALFGQTVATSVGCVSCGKTFDLDFALADLDRQSRSDASAPAPDGVFQTVRGDRFRLPTGEDEYAVLGMVPDEAERVLLERCVVDGEPGAVQTAMETAAPILALDLSARCPECGHEQPVHFDIQHYLLTALRQERAMLVDDVSRLARNYGWGLRDVMELPRSTRRAFADALEPGDGGAR